RDVFFIQAEDGIRDATVTGVQTCALPIFCSVRSRSKSGPRSRATTMPPSTSEWPPRYLVVACTIRSAPSLNGDDRIGVAVVLSHTKRAPAARAMAAILPRSLTFHSGLDGDSAHTSVVVGRTAFSTAPRSVMSTNVVASP